MNKKVPSPRLPQRAQRVNLTSVLACLACLTLAGVSWRVLTHYQTASPDVAPGKSVDSSPPLFKDVSKEANVRFTHVTGGKGAYWIPEEMGPGGAFFDYDNDGDLDIYLVQGGEIARAAGPTGSAGDNAQYRNRLLRNDGSGRFDDVSEGSGADLPGYGMGCAAADYDNDGDVDLYVTRLGPDALLRNNGDGTFTDVTQAAGIDNAGFGTCVSFVDYDRDGHLDIYVANYIDWSPHREHVCYDLNGARDFCNPLEYEAPAADKLFHNLGNGQFEDASKRSNVASKVGHSLGVLCSDFDGDGWVDVFVASDQTPGILWLNQKDGTFAEDGALRGCAFNADGMAISGMGVAAEDLDLDGDYDLIVTNIQNQPHLCLRNDGGLFEDVSHAWGFGGWGVPYTAFGIAVFDQDNDASLDAFIGNGAVNRLRTPYLEGHLFAEPNQFIRRNRSGRFIDASAEAGPALLHPGVTRGTIQGDYDNDGDIDILVTNNGGEAQLLRNENATGHAWTLLDLIPEGGPRHAINARLELEAGGRIFRREVRPHVGYLGSNDPRIHVGLKDAKVIGRLTVTWPNGDAEEWRDLPVNRVLQIRQDSTRNSK